MHVWDAAAVSLVASVAGLLLVATVIGAILSARAKTDAAAVTK